MSVETQERMRLALRRTEVARMYVTRNKVAEIAESVGCSAAVVRADLKVIREEWRASTITNFNAVRMEELAKLDAIETEGFDAWRRSQGEVKKVTSQTSDKAARIQTQESSGDPRFLKIVLDCMTRRMQLLGLESPKWMLHDIVTPDERKRREELEAEEGVAISRLGELLVERWAAASAVGLGGGGGPASGVSDGGDSDGEGWFVPPDS